MLPDDYSSEHRTRIREYLAAARLNYAAVTKKMREPPTINVLRRPVSQRHWRLLRKPCGSGCNFATITPKGVVYRCGSGQRLGNLLRKNVSLLTGPRPCDASYCPYFCEKYTSAQFLPKTSRFRYTGAGTPAMAAA